MNIFAVAVVGYLALTLFVGLWFVRKQPSTIEEYALAGRGLSTIALTVSFIATFIGSGDIEGMNVCYEQGLRSLITYPFSHLIGAFVVSRWVYPRLVGRGYFTLGDVVEPLFGRAARVFLGVLWGFFCFGYITAELALLGRFSSMAGLPASWLILAAGVALVLYTTTGGVRSVTVTDFLQFVFIVGGLFFLSKVVIDKVGGFQLIFERVWDHPSYHQKIAIWENAGEWWAERLRRTIFWAWPITLFSPPYFQRAAMASSKRQIGEMIKFFSCFFATFSLLIWTISFAAFSIPGVEPPFGEEKLLFLAIIKAVVHSKAGLILMLFCSLSILLSVADSFLNAGSVVLVRDVFQPLMKQPIDQLTWVKGTAAGLGLCAVAFSCFWGALPANLNYATVKVLLSIAVFPIVSGMLGLKTTPRMFWSCLLSFFLLAGLVFVCKASHILSLKTGIERIQFVWYFSLPGSIFTFLAVHLLHFGRLEIVKDEGEEGVREVVPGSEGWSWAHLLQMLNLVELARSRARKYGKEDVLFPLFMAVVYMIPSFTARKGSSTFVEAETAIHLVGMALCALLLGRTFWAQKALRGFSLFYFLTLGYCLPFVFTFRFFCNTGDPMSIVWCGIASLLLSVLVDAELLLLLSFLGAGGAVVVWKLYQGSWFPAMRFDQGWGILWTSVATLVVGTFFGRRRQRRYDLLHEGLQQAALREQELSADYLHALDHSKVFAENLEEQCLDSLESGGRLMLDRKLGQAELESIAQKIILAATHLRQLDRHLHGHLVLHLSTHPLGQIAGELLGAAPLTSDRLKLELDSLPLAELVRWDLPKVKEVVLQALVVLDSGIPEEEYLLVRFDRTAIAYTEGERVWKKVPALRVLLSDQQSRPSLLEEYRLEVGELEGQVAYQGLSASRAKRVIQAHRGLLEQGNGYYALVLPQQVDAVRPKKLDKPGPSDEQMEQAIRTVLPEEAKLREALRDANLLTPAIEEAITLMKRYHAHQSRKLEGPFAIHPLETARIVLGHLQAHPQPEGKSGKRVSTDQALMAALLHDVVEDTKADFTLVGSIWGPEVQQMVAKVSKLTEGLVSLKLANEEAVAKFADISDPVGYHAALIKVADRLHNMRTIEGHKDLEKQKKIARETVAVYEKLAHKLGARDILLEMHGVSERVLGKKLPLPGELPDKPAPAAAAA